MGHFVRVVLRKGLTLALAVGLGAAAMAALDSSNVFAAIVNRGQLGQGEMLVNQSVSFDSQRGDLASYRSVPEGRYWQLQTLRATNCEDQPRPMEFVLADRDGTTHAVLSLEGATPTIVAAHGALAWTGSVMVAEGWRIYARWHAMAGGGRCNWQYTAIERTAAP
ncbi:MAG: hypothetical protein QOJ09_334 [Actinomycetota bacterium]|jgi:hypothetical protein|nr:hypothetical protein [Actinomycetota bacterium]